MRVRRPLLGLAAVLLFCAVLGVLGLGVEGKLQPLSLSVPGTASARGQELAERQFGDSSPFIVLLRGSAAAIDRQGPGLVAALRREPKVAVISPWDRGSVAGLRAGPRRALILLDFHVPAPEAMRHTVPALERILEERIHPPVRAIQSGFADVARALQEESLRASERAELLAAPLLAIVLLLVFRSLVAAAIPLALGALTVFAGRGVLALLSSVMSVDAISLVVCTMMGLALGVDYSLLIVSRFREELAGGRHPREAASASRASAGRTTVFAGSTLLAAILFSAFLQPGSLLLSLAVAVAVVTVISVALASLVLPALLALLGPAINAVPIGPPPGPNGSRAAAVAGTAIRRPAVAIAVIAIPVLLLAVPALALNTGTPGIDELPSGSPARQSAAEIDRAVGPGWEAPFTLIAEAPDGPITTPRRLALLARWQKRIAAERQVRAVIGPARISRKAAPLRELGQRLAAVGKGGADGLARVGPGLRRAAGAVARLRSGIARASSGSGLLGEGAERAERGAGLIAAGLGRVADGGRRATAAMERLANGSRRLARAQREASAAGLSVALGLRSLLPNVRGNGLARARRLAAELEEAARSDPSVKPQATQARILAHALSSARNEVRQLRGVAVGLSSGLERIASGGKRLEGGNRRLAGATPRLVGGIDRLAEGARRLTSGLAELQGGAGALQRGLAGGFHRSYPLQTGLGRAGTRVSAAVAPIVQGAKRLNRSSPHLFESGYFVISAIEGAPPIPRAYASEAVDIEQGGQAARMLVISKQAFNTEGSRQIGARLAADAVRLGREGHLRTGVTGGAATLNDYGDVTKARIPLVIGAVVLISFLMLVAIVRALPLAVLAVVLNLGSVAAAIGVTTLVCKIPAGYPLGGHPYIDTVSAAAIFGVTFGLSIDYAVFLIVRMRERYELDGDNRAAIAFGLEKTAGVITGAAAIMAAVFVSFAIAPIATVSQMGIGLTVAILLDATVVRILLLPALMLLIGDRVWWLPGPLDRVLPRLNFHGAGLESARETI